MIDELIVRKHYYCISDTNACCPIFLLGKAMTLGYIELADAHYYPLIHSHVIKFYAFSKLFFMLTESLFGVRYFSQAFDSFYAREQAKLST